MSFEHMSSKQILTEKLDRAHYYVRYSMSEETRCPVLVKRECFLVEESGHIIAVLSSYMSEVDIHFNYRISENSEHY